MNIPSPSLPSFSSTASASANPSSSSSSWFSGFVRGRSAKTMSAPPSSAAASASADSSLSSLCPVIKKNHFCGVLFRYGPKSMQVAFKTGDYKQQVVFIGGLTDGFMATEYVDFDPFPSFQSTWNR